LLEAERVGVHDNFFSLGGDSFLAAEATLEIQNHLGVVVPPSILVEAPTIRDLARVLEESPCTPARDVLAKVQPEGDRTPLFLVHPVGGEVLCYADLASLLAPHQPVYGIRAGRPAGRDEPFTHIEDMAAHYVRELCQVQPCGPYRLGGYSFGGCVALEMAQQLHARGQVVEFLGLLDHVSPLLRYGRVRRGPAFWVEVARNLPHWIYDRLFPHGVRDRVNWVLRKPRAAQRIVSSFLSSKLLSSRSSSDSGRAKRSSSRSSRLQSIQRVADACYKAMAVYVPKPYSGPVTLFRAKAQPILKSFGRDLGWKKLIRGNLEIIPVPGNHRSIFDEPYVLGVARHLIRCLEKLESAQPLERVQSA
jgi:thioesterase domain-containing protein